MCDLNHDVSLWYHFEVNHCGSLIILVFPSLNTNCVFPSLNTNCVFPSLNTNCVFPSLNTNSVFHSLNTNRVFPSLNTNSVFHSLNTNRVFPSLNTNSVFPSLNTNSFFRSLNTNSFSSSSFIISFSSDVISSLYTRTPDCRICTMERIPARKASTAPMTDRANDQCRWSLLEPNMAKPITMKRTGKTPEHN